MKKSKEPVNYQFLYKSLVAALLDDLKNQSEASLGIISRHLSTFSGIIKMQLRKGSKEHKAATKAYNKGSKSLKEVEDTLRRLDSILENLYKGKKI